MSYARIFAAAIAMVGSVPVMAQQLVIADGGQSDFRIVLASEASPSERYAAEELRRFIAEISGARLPIEGDAGPLSAHEIILGNNAHLRQLNTKIDFDRLGNEGFTIRTVGGHLAIAGGRLRGTLYGVYTLLEDYLGCRWFAPDCSYIPRRRRIAIGPINDTQLPTLEYREVFYKHAFDPDWCARNKLNSNAAPLDEKHGGKVAYYGFVHTFNSLLPPEKYFDEHPEYYSLRNGRRIKERTQLCCTNPEVKRLVAEEVLRRMRAHPEATVFSVSQNDWGNWCECPRCRAVMEREGSPIGPILELANYVADYVRDEFPDKIVDTLAYHYSRKPPAHMRPRPNVVIRLCTIECCFSHPLATCDSKANSDFRRDIERWGKIHKRLWIWDYVVDFPHYLLPFPNLNVLQPNIQFFIDHGVTGVFEEGNYTSVGGEFAELRAYLLAKLLWNPDYDVEKAMSEFLQAYYGAAAGPIRQYIDLIHEKVRRENIHVNIWQSPENARYLSDDILARANELFDNAEAAVASDPVLLQRVRVARLPVQYVMLRRHKPAAPAPYVLEGGLYRPEQRDPMAAVAQRFAEVARKKGITHYGEHRLRSIAGFLSELKRKFGEYRVLSLENDKLKLAVVPELGGRIIGLWLKPSERNLCHMAQPGEAQFPASGGYGAWWKTAGFGPGWSDAFAHKLSVEAGAQQLKLTTVLEGGAQLVRTISLAQRGAAFTITTRLTNTSQAALPGALNTSFRLSLGPPEELTLVAGGQAWPLAPGQGHAEGGRGLAPAQLSDGVAIVNHKLGLAIRWAASGPAVRSGGVRVNAAGPLSELRVACAGELAPGGSTELSERFEIVEDVTRFPRAEARTPGAVAGAVCAQQDEFHYVREGQWAEARPDPSASDGACAWMPGTHYEWAVQWRPDPARFARGTTYALWAAVKVDKAKEQGQALSAGVYDTAGRRTLCARSISLKVLKQNTWTLIKVGEFQPSPAFYIWFAPPREVGNVKSVSVDYVEAIPVARGSSGKRRKGA